MLKLRGLRSIAHRRHEPLGGLEFFPTPPWATRALVEHVIGKRGLSRLDAWEPACGEGHMAAVLEEYFASVAATDVFPYGFGGVRDFLDTTFQAEMIADWLITNPPFETADRFLELMLRRARVGVALFVRAGFLQSQERWRGFYRDTPPTTIAYFVERVSLVKGHWDPLARSATDYVWLVWRKGQKPRPPMWIPPCRKRLTRVDDAARFGVKREPEPTPLFDEAA